MGHPSTYVSRLWSTCSRLTISIYILVTNYLFNVSFHILMSVLISLISYLMSVLKWWVSLSHFFYWSRFDIFYRCRLPVYFVFLRWFLSASLLFSCSLSSLCLWFPPLAFLSVPVVIGHGLSLLKSIYDFLWVTYITRSPLAPLFNTSLPLLFHQRQYTPFSLFSLSPIIFSSDRSFSNLPYLSLPSSTNLT